MKSFEFQAKTVEKAIEKGLQELGKSKFDVDIKILENGGLFKKAKVLISFEDEDLSLKDLMTAPEQEKEESVSLKPEKNEEEVKLNHDDEIAILPLKNEEYPVNIGHVQEVEQVEETVELNVEENSVEEDVDAEEQPVEQKTEKKQRVYENNKGSKQFIEGLLQSMNVNATVIIEEQDEHTKAIIQTEQAGLVIGHRGEGLSAIQYLANIVEQKQNRYAKRLIVDVADYREKRDDSLKDLADRMARQCLKLRKAIKLKPMNAYDRRIVHTYLQNFKGVNTHSVGKEPNRCLIIDINRD